MLTAPAAAKPALPLSISSISIWRSGPKEAAYTKQRRVHRVPISHEAVALIRLRGDAVAMGCPFLFPGDVPGQPVVDLKRFWEQMRVKAEIPDVRIHDLRHTFASLLVSGGASLEAEAESGGKRLRFRSKSGKRRLIALQSLHSLGIATGGCHG